MSTLKEKELNERYPECEYIDTSNMDIEILSENKFVKMEGILLNGKKVSPPLVKVTYDKNGVEESLLVTDDHPLITQYGMTDAIALTSNHILYNAKTGESYKVLRVEETGITEDTFDLETETHLFDLSGIVSHNCRTYVEGDNLVEYNTNEEPKKYKFVRTHRPPYEITAGRGNFNFITLNLPKFAIESVLNTKNAKMRKKNDLIVQNEMLSKFFKYILDYSVKAKNILQIKEEIIGNKLGKNFQFVIGQNIIIGSDEIEENDQTHKIWEHFSKSIGYIGLYEAMLLLYNKDHSIDKEHGEEIVRFIRKFTDNLSKGFYILPTEKGSREPEWWKKINNYNESTYSNKNKEKSYWDECFQVYDMTNNEPIYLADCEWE